MGDLGAHKTRQIYQTLTTHSRTTIHRTRSAWEVDIPTLTDDDWTEALASPQYSVVSTRYRLIQFKYLHRTYFTCLRLYKMGVIRSPTCLRCESEEGSFFHTVWSCVALQLFWSGVRSCSEQVLAWHIPADPRLLLLHATEDIGGNRYKRHLLFLGITLAKRDIAQHWKATSPPSVGTWKKAMDRCLSAEIAVFQARGCPQKHKKIWARWATYCGIDLSLLGPTVSRDPIDKLVVSKMPI